MELTPEQQKDLWGDHGPYSEVRLQSHVQLLDLSQSYPLIEVIAFINPLTFKVIKQNLRLFKEDTLVCYIISKAEYNKKNEGYDSCVYFSKEITDEVMRTAGQYLEKTKEAVLRMHEFTMELLELEGGCSSIRNIH